MLIYHPAFDAYHSTFRFAALASSLAIIDLEKARILDFYIAFPAAITSMRLPNDLSSLRSAIRRITNPYRAIPNPKRTFTDMAQVQFAALGCLAAANLIDPAQLRSGIVKRTTNPLSDELSRRIALFLDRDDGLVRSTIDKLSSIPTTGINGLKARSELLEYRYDVA